MRQIHPGGVFEGDDRRRRAAAALPARGRLRRRRQVHVDDPYSFLPTLGELDQYLIGEGRHEELYERLGAHVRGPGDRQTITGTAFAVWAPAARRSASSAISTPGTAACTRCARSGRPGSGSCSSRRRARGALQVRDPAPRTIRSCSRPTRTRFETEVPPEDRVGRIPAGAHLECGGPRMAGDQGQAAAGTPAAGLDLRGPPRFLAAELARGQPLPLLRRARRRADPPTSRTWASRTSS